MSGRGQRIWAVIVGVGATLAAAGCGAATPGPGGGHGTSAERSGAGASTGRSGASYPVAIPVVSFARHQLLAGRERFVIAVRNDGTRTLPNVAATICNTTCAPGAPRGQGTTVQAFARAIASQPTLASASRPLWIVQRPPGRCGYSCANLGPGAAVTAYSNTWALGPLRPGATTRFAWTLTPVVPGRHTVAWEISAALTGANRAVLRGGRPARGTIVADVSRSPPQYVVQPDGKVRRKR